MNLRLLLVAGVLLLASFLLVGADKEVKLAIPADQWREDLRYFAKELPRRHKNAYHAVSKEDFDRALADLDAALPTLQPHQIVVRLQQITALVGDGHTTVHLPASFQRYPLGLWWFGNELRVTGAGKEYPQALGTRVIKIGGVPLDEVMTRVTRCFPSAENENAWYVLSTSVAFLAMPEVLQTLGVVPDLGPATFTLQADGGEPFDLAIAPVEFAQEKAGPTLRLTSAVKEEPLFRQRMGEPFWFMYLPDAKTVYVAFRSYKGLGENAKKLWRFVDTNSVQKLVIDLRHNGGGDYTEGQKHLIEPIKDRPALNQKGHLYVAIGRRTFSAALANATHFRKETQAILVGEPIGERPHSYSENDEMTLPNSRLVVSYSTRYYTFGDEDVPAVMPDQRIDPDWEAFKAGRDPVMEWILSAP